MSKPFLEFVHPEDRSETIKAVEEQITIGAAVIQFENRYLCKDGTYRWLQWNGNPDVSNKLIYAIARDVTEQKKSVLKYVS